MSVLLSQAKIGRTEAPRLSMQGFSWEGELAAGVDDDKADSDDDDDDGDNIVSIYEQWCLLFHYIWYQHYDNWTTTIPSGNVG